MRYTRLCCRTRALISTAPAGPTHQPVELAALFRAMPNVNLVRPADAEECMGMWLLALDQASADTPAIFALSRQPVPLLPGTDRQKVKLGAYTVWGEEDASKVKLTIISTGAEVARAIETAELLKDKGGVRVVSMPSQRHFDLQSAEYKQQTIPTSTSLVVAIEAWASYGWARYAHASLTMQSFVRIHLMEQRNSMLILAMLSGPLRTSSHAVRALWFCPQKHGSTHRSVGRQVAEGGPSAWPGRVRRASCPLKGGMCTVAR